MLNIYKANLHKLIKNIYFIGGCIIALAVTYAFTSGIVNFPPVSKYGPETVFLFVSAAMVFFFAIFTPMFVCAEYTDGVIRNRILAGHTQKNDSLAMILAMISALLIMSLFYIAGGIIGCISAGSQISGKTVLLVFVDILAYCGFTALIAATSYRIKNYIGAFVFGFMLFVMAYNCVMFGNAILMVFADSSAFKPLACLYNVNALGQWFSNTPLVDDFVNPGAAAQIIMSVAVLVLSFFIGIAGIEKRDLK